LLQAAVRIDCQAPHGGMTSILSSADDAAARPCRSSARKPCRRRRGPKPTTRVFGGSLKPLRARTVATDDIVAIRLFILRAACRQPRCDLADQPSPLRPPRNGGCVAGQLLGSS
jgi:hypothetical protein